MSEITSAVASPGRSVYAVDDAADPRLEPYAAIRERDLRGHGDRFIAEGEVVLRVLLSTSRFRADSILVSERRLHGLGPLLATAPADVPVLVAGQAVMDRLVGFHIHRGVLAVGRRLPEPCAGSLLASLPRKRLVVALVGVSNHDNVGGIFRNAAAFGADAVLLDHASCDPL
ncbi:putative rRNA methylase [Lutibaculum baratangense AMV1]|uniref:Putative rRNA methylase n=1 Tax=Lutibaculum baratangense AMV1 TaxID=631454 RepID=V4TCV6_9HYPH|nr:putative rRNA methylase [Lutibaculum baratangense AMV1]